MAERVDFDLYIDNYNELLRERTQFFSSSEEYFARYKVGIVAERRSRPVARLLEFGCGIGRNIPFLHDAFPGAGIGGTNIAEGSVDHADAAPVIRAVGGHRTVHELASVGRPVLGAGATAEVT